MHPIVRQIVLNRGLVNQTSAASSRKNEIENYYENLKDQIIQHVVQEDDTVGGLALRYRTTSIAIHTLNRFSSPNQRLKVDETLLVIPEYKSLDMEPLKSVIFNLEVEKKSLQYQSPESLTLLFGPQRTVFGFSNWGTHDIGFEDPRDVNYFHQKQEEYSARSAIPYSIRCYLRIKSGFMSESFSFRKYQRVWCLLVDQHLLVFRNDMDLHPQRIIYFNGRCWKTYRTAASLCIAFEISVGKTAKIFYKFETEEECRDWFELFQLVSKESIGPSVRDTTQIPFRDYFRDITTCSHQPNTVITLDATDLSKRQAEWNWMISNGSTGGMKYTGDIECDDAIDGLWNIDQGRIAHEENQEILRVILMRCRDLIAEDDLMDSRSEDTNNNDTLPSYANPKITTFLTAIYTTPLWFDEKLFQQGGVLLLSSIMWLFVTYLDWTFIEILSSSEAISIWASLAAGINMAKDNSPKVDPIEVNLEELVARVTVSTKEVELFLKKFYGLLLRTLLASSTNCLKPSSAIWIEFVDLRLELSLLRRKILSICGVGRWDESIHGMPFSQYFLGYSLGLFALHSIQIIQSLRCGFLSDLEKKSILHFWAFVGSLIGIESLYNPCLDSMTDFLQHMTREMKLHYNPTLDTQNSSSSSLSSFSSNSEVIEILQHPQYYPHFDSNYFHCIVSILHKTASRLLPSPTDLQHNWSPSNHYHFSRLSFQFHSQSTLRQSIIQQLGQQQFSFLIYLSLLLQLFWIKVLYFFGISSSSSTSANVQQIKRLEQIFSNDISSIGVEKTSVRLWQDDETIKMNE